MDSKQGQAGVKGCDGDTTPSISKSLKDITDAEVEMKDMANISGTSVVAEQDTEEFEHIEASMNADKNISVNTNKSIDSDQDKLNVKATVEDIVSSDGKKDLCKDAEVDRQKDSPTETNVSEPMEPQSLTSSGFLSEKQNKDEHTEPKSVSGSVDLPEEQAQSVQQKPESLSGSCKQSNCARKIVEYKFPELNIGINKRKGINSGNSGTKTETLDMSGTLEVPLRNVRKVSFTLGEGTMISLEDHNFLMEKRRKSEANVSDEKYKPPNQYRKHSSGDLHSRLKTRKLLGVGETDDGDVHRSKLSQILGHSDQLYIRLPSGLRIWQIVLAVLFTVMSVWALLFPTHYFVTMFEADGTTLIFPIRLYATALVSISVMYWSTVHAADRDVIRLVLLSSIVFFTLQTVVIAVAQLSNKESFSRWSTNLLGLQIIFALIGYYFYWSVVSQKASCSLKRTSSNSSLRRTPSKQELADKEQ